MATVDVKGSELFVYISGAHVFREGGPKIIITYLCDLKDTLHHCGHPQHGPPVPTVIGVDSV